jgi:hypothetical protein
VTAGADAVTSEAGVHLVDGRTDAIDAAAAIAER